TPASFVGTCSIAAGDISGPYTGRSFFNSDRFLAGIGHIRPFPGQSFSICSAISFITSFHLCSSPCFCAYACIVRGTADHCPHIPITASMLFPPSAFYSLVVGSFLSFLAPLAQSSNSFASWTFTPVCGFSIPQAFSALEKLLKCFRICRRRTADILSTSAL